MIFLKRLSSLSLAAVLVGGLACRKPEPAWMPAATKVDPVLEEAAKAKAAAEAERKRKMEADARRKAEAAKAEAARKAERAARDAQAKAAIEALQDIPFAFDKADLSADGKARLQAIGAFLNAYPKVCLQIEGHCDERGIVEYNLSLGERRAHAVLDYLKGLGVAAGRLDATSFGKERPQCTDANEACWRRNRRAAFLAKD